LQSSDRALAEVAEVAEAQGFQSFAVAEPLLKFAEAGGFWGEVQQASATP
jgi:hypothetical protein